MKGRFDVQISTSGSTSDVLNRITAATEREEFPFISASRYPRQREKAFVSKISGSRFRVWKVPSSTRSRQNVCIPYLSGVAEDVNGRTHLRGSFALHPFNKLMAFLPLTVIVPLWLWTERTPRSVMLLTAISVILVGAELAMIAAVRRLRPKEEKDIVQFLLGLLPDARPD